MTLDFCLLDDLALAVQLRHIDARPYLAAAEVHRLGPLIELAILSRTTSLSLDLLPNCTVRDAVSAIISADEEISVKRSADGRFGFMKTSRDPYANDQTQWVVFCRSAQEAAEEAGLHKTEAQQLIGALREMEDNVHAHSTHSKGGIVGYAATAGQFEFVVGDPGVGVLGSLRQCPEYYGLRDAGTAMKLALSDGVSRFGKISGRGYGFHGLFVGLANMSGQLRFRSGDHALIIDGTELSLMHARLDQRAHLQGFVISVLCGARRDMLPH